jgi:hypothetical protein
MIETWSGLDFMLTLILKEALVEVGEKVNNRMRYYIEQDVYVGHNEVYKNTYQFLNAVTTSLPTIIRDSVSVKVYIDPNKMQSDPENYTHGSPKWSPNDIREYLPEILAFNTSGNLFGANQWWHNRDNYFYDTLNSLAKGGELRVWFMAALRARGIMCK